MSYIKIQIKYIQPSGIIDKKNDDGSYMKNDDGGFVREYSSEDVFKTATLALPKRVIKYGDKYGYDNLGISSYEDHLIIHYGTVTLMDKDINGSDDYLPIRRIESYEWIDSHGNSSKQYVPSNNSSHFAPIDNSSSKSSAPIKNDSDGNTSMHSNGNTSMQFVPWNLPKPKEQMTAIDYHKSFQECWEHNGSDIWDRIIPESAAEMAGALLFCKQHANLRWGESTSAVTLRRLVETCDMDYADNPEVQKILPGVKEMIKGWDENAAKKARKDDIVSKIKLLLWIVALVAIIVQCILWGWWTILSGAATLVVAGVIHLIIIFIHD